MKLGLYDSGLGGLTVLRALRAAGVTHEIVYFADQAHVPYGDRSDTDLQALLSENFALLAAYGIDAIVMACNTSCAVAERNGGFPPARGPVLDLIANAAHALRDTTARRIAVVATAATVRCSAYARAIARVAPHLVVTEVAAPELVPLVERGDAATPAGRAAVRAVVAMLPADIDALVYGCTHYPLLDAHFAALLGPNVARIDPALAQAQATVALLSNDLRDDVTTGATHYVTNGDPAAFAANIHAWTGETSPLVSAASLLVSTLGLG